MELKTLQQHWNCFGRTDPFWSILTHPERKGNRWDIDEFFRTGEQWIRNLMREVHELGLEPRGRCLDFGCGVGRLTQALCEHFDSCDGIDIAPSMIELARQYNRHGERCRYHVNEAPDLGMFADGSFSFVLSMIVLQHIAPQYSHGYIAELIRLLAPGGALVFQVPGAYVGARTRPTLPSSAYRAVITVPMHRLWLQPGERFTLNIGVHNQSPVRWPAYPLDGYDFARINLGNHWRGVFGTIVQLDDGRAHLPELRADQQVSVPLTIRAPSSPGLYRLELDIVEEGVTWFADRGSRTSRRWVFCRRPWRARNRAKLSIGTDHRADFSPIMEMHCIPADQVLRTVEASGGRVLCHAPDNFCGELYESYHYIVTKP